MGGVGAIDNRGSDVVDTTDRDGGDVGASRADTSDRCRFDDDGDMLRMGERRLWELVRFVGEAGGGFNDAFAACLCSAAFGEVNPLKWC